MKKRLLLLLTAIPLILISVLGLFFACPYWLFTGRSLMCEIVDWYAVLYDDN
jgi:hypothetical protein